MQSPEDHQRSRPRTFAARRTKLLGFERLESRDMLAAAAVGAEADADVYADIPSDFVWDYEQWFAAFAGAQDTPPPEPAIVSDDLFIAEDQAFVWDDSYVWDGAFVEDQAFVEGPGVVVCPGVVMPPLEVPDQHGSDAKADPVLDEYSRFLALNATWFDDHGGNAIQPQVITPSRHLPWIELPTPGAANAFDAWYSLTYVETPSANGSDPISETDPGDSSEPPESDDAMPPTWVNDSGDDTVVGPVYSVTRSDFGGIPSQPPVASSTAGATQASSRNWFAWMPFLGMGGFGGDTSESSKPAKAKRFAR